MSSWSTNRLVAFWLAFMFAALGILGFSVSASSSSGMLFGFLEVDLTANLIHLFCILGIPASFSGNDRFSNKFFGLIFGLLAIVGLLSMVMPALAPGGMLLGLFHINLWGHLLNLVAALLWIGASYFNMSIPGRSATA